MKVEHVREILLKAIELKPALDLLAGSDVELRRHLVALLIKEWERGYDCGYEQAQRSNS